jgi:hypothetical protein
MTTTAKEKAMGHTPGPWRATGWSIYSCDGLPVARAAVDYCADTIADEEWSEFNERSSLPESVAWANARLIAAAPQLLEALKAVALEEDFRTRRQLARAAIAAAEGEKP